MILIYFIYKIYFKWKMNSVIIKTQRIDFVMVKCPLENEMLDFINILKLHSINILIRINKDLYNVNLIKKEIPNIIVKDLYFPDGSYPPDNIINEYKLFINDYIKQQEQNISKPNILIHCIASLGRSPCIIALEMILTEKKLSRFDIVSYIRNIKKGCFNQKQLNWIFDYKIPNNSNFFNKLKLYCHLMQKHFIN